MGFKENPENINRNGRPKKGLALTDVMRDMLESKGEDGKEKRVKLAESVLAMAMEGDQACIKMIWEHLEGKPVQKNIIEAEIKDKSALSKYFEDKTKEK